MKGMRNKLFPYYEDWLVLFGKDRATRDLAEGPTNYVAAIETKEATKVQGLISLFYNSVLLTWSPCQPMVGSHLPLLHPMLTARKGEELLKGYQRDSLKWLMLLG